ncbi:MAG: helix-turn-helix transcriptional regulator [Phycisphaeraceae bacterium]|nr:MAG: helix-turn-helix transcriptional regulator [Phycisphaeraceae bacterium]
MRMDDARFTRISRALADPRRRAILERIAGADEVPCRSIVEGMSITQATISHHVKELIGAGLIRSRREGKCCFFSIRKAEVERYRRALAARLGTLSPGAVRTARSRRAAGGG